MNKENNFDVIIDELKELQHKPEISKRTYSIIKVCRPSYFWKSQYIKVSYVKPAIIPLYSGGIMFIATFGVSDPQQIKSAIKDVRFLRDFFAYLESVSRVNRNLSSYHLKEED